MAKLKFEQGKFYKHTSGSKLHICGTANSIGHGDCLIGESFDFTYTPVGTSSEHTVNWHEITKEEFMKREPIKFNPVHGEIKP